jgi:hypothetical protein
VTTKTKKEQFIEVPTGELEAVAKWTSHDANRPHLHMVLFANNEYVATDGHRLVRVPCETHGLALGVDRGHLLAAVDAQRAMFAAQRPPASARSGVIRLAPYMAESGVPSWPSWIRRVQVSFGFRSRSGSGLVRVQVSFGE